VRLDWFDSASAAEAAGRKLGRAKERRGYRADEVYRKAPEEGGGSAAFGQKRQRGTRESQECRAFARRFTGRQVLSRLVP
jgi:RNA-splicing ligase RtcB